MTLCRSIVFSTGLMFGAIASAHAADTAAQREAGWQRHQQLVAASPFNGMEWRSIGPTVQGGRVVDVAAVPGQPYTFYVAYATGGVWKTVNDGGSFEPLTDGLPTTVIGAIAVDAQHPDTLWVGTGEPNASRSSYGGMGLFRSDDGGKTFHRAGLADSDRISRIVVDPSNSQRIFVAVQGRLYTDGGERGIWRSDDNGQHWSRVLKSDRPNTGAIDLVLDPANPNIVYAALWERSRRPWNFVESGAGSGIYKSIDGGNTWTRSSNGFPQGAGVGRIGLAVARSHPQTLYATVDNQDKLPEGQQYLGDRPLNARRLKTMGKDEFLRQDPDEVESFIRSSDLDVSVDAKSLMESIRNGSLTMDQLRARLRDANAALFDTDIRGLEVYRSDDGGANWRRTHSEPLREVDYTYGYYFGQVRVAPDDPEHVYVQGLPLITSSDGGKTWAGLNQPNVHVDFHTLWIDPADPQRMIVGNDGGLDISHDGGRHFRTMDAQAVGQFYTVVADMADPYYVYGGLQDNGSWKGVSNVLWDHNVWSAVGGGDGMHVQVDTRDNATLYTGSQFGYYGRRGPGGKGDVRPQAGLKETPLRYNWNTPILLSPHNQDIVYFGTDKLFRSMDKGVTWTAISPDLTTSKERGDVPYATITSISESPKRFGLLWVGTDDGHVDVSDDGGIHWNAVDKSLPKQWVSRVVASSHDEHRAYVTLNGYRNDDMTPWVFRSDDMGKSWTSISAGLPSESVNVIREDPVNADVLYVGTDRGVYVSLDRGAHWDSLQANLPNVPVHDLAVHPRERELIAGTHGRSVWIVDVLPVQELSKVRNETVHLFPVEKMQFDRDWKSSPSLWFDESQDLPRLKLPFWAKAAGTAQLTVLDKNGHSVREASIPAKAGINTYTWDLLVDRDLALAAERASLTQAPANQAAAAKGAGTADQDKVTLDKTPVAEAVRLQQRLYAPPGTYTLRLSLDGATSEAKWELKAPEPQPPRAPPKPKLRGKDDWPRPRPEPDPLPGAEDAADR
jgi:photosystem II stability/assembly factor-like uncharacterized protein